MVFSGNPCGDAWPPFTLSCLSAVITILLSMVTIPGNFLVCYVLIRDPNKELKSSFNYILFNLALADLLLGITEPITVVHFIRESLVIKETIRILWISHVTFFIATTASLLSIIALTVERYLAITSNYVKKVEPKRAIYLSIGIWLVTLSVSGLYFVLGAFVFVFFSLNVLTITTLCTLCVTSVSISHKLRRTACSLNTLDGNNAGNATLKIEQKVTQTFTIMLGLFTLTYVPSLVFAYVIAFCDVCSCDVIHWSRDFLFRFVMFNCAINQFIYVWRIPSFLRAMNAILGTNLRRRIYRNNRVGTGTEMAEIT